MTDDERSADNVERCRRINRRAAEQYAQHGVSPADIAIAAAISAVDLAQHHVGGDPIAAIAWVRRALDVFEEGAPLSMETIQ